VAKVGFRSKKVVLGMNKGKNLSKREVGNKANIHTI
jgi:hypothetical protein